MSDLLELPRIITNGFVTLHPECVFLFAYDVQKKSMFGQAAILGHENTYPIPTLYKFCNSGARYFTDGDSACRVYIDNALVKVPSDKRIIPLRKIGEGCSRMKELAPKLWSYMNERLREIEDKNIKWRYDW